MVDFHVHASQEHLEVQKWCLYVYPLYLHHIEIEDSTKMPLHKDFYIVVHLIDY